MNDDSLVSGDVAAEWRELAADAAYDLIGRLAEVARTHDVMVNISVSPYQSNVDDDE